MTGVTLHGAVHITSTAVLRCFFFFFSSRRRHTRLQGDWSSDVCSSDLASRCETVSRNGCRIPAPAPCASTYRRRASAGRTRSAETSPVVSPTLTDRKSTRLNSSHLVISYAVFCLKKKKKESRIIHKYDE